MAWQGEARRGRSSAQSGHAGQEGGGESCRGMQTRGRGAYRQSKVSLAGMGMHAAPLNSFSALTTTSICLRRNSAALVRMAKDRRFGCSATADKAVVGPPTAWVAVGTAVEAAVEAETTAAAAGEAARVEVAPGRALSRAGCAAPPEVACIRTALNPDPDAESGRLAVCLDGLSGACSGVGAPSVTKFGVPSAAFHDTQPIGFE